MGKIVKYCNSCEEGFAEKFAFCPNCGSGLTAFELNPVQAEAPQIIDEAPQIEKTEPIFNMAPAEPEIPVTYTESSFSESLLEIDEPFITDEPEVITEPIISFTNQKPDVIESFSEEIVEEKVPEKTVTISGFTPIFNQTETTQFADDEYLGDESEPIHYKKDVGESEYRPTFVEDRNRGNRLKLLLGAMALVTIVTGGSWVYSLFAKGLNLDGVDDEIYSYVTPPNDDPFEREKEIIEKKNTDKGGGGGGGGKNEKEPTSQGQLARQMEKPDLSPSARMDRVTDPALTQRVGTEGKAKTNIDPNQRYGDPKGGTTISDGSGTGGGQGTGTGTGQGRGEGTGRGAGRGSGSGNGDGNGNGDGRGDGDNDEPPTRPTPTPRPRPTIAPTPEPKVVVANNFRILSNPQPKYTDAGRLNNVNGVVRLKVTFLASGQIGGVSVINGLPFGLTEQAIGAAKSIKFVPGPNSMSKTIEYRFNLY
jgi:Gram-negative bacterial TonB protein C-terminal